MISRFSSYRKEILLTLTILISAFTILGWNLDINELKGDFHNFIPMSQSGAICFASISLSLLIYLRLQSRFFHVIGYYLLGLVWMYAGLVLSRFILHFKFDPEGIFVVTSWMKGFIPKGRMSPVTALIFILLISSFFVHILHLNNTFQKIKKVTIIIIGIGCFLLITGYLYNTPLLYSENIIPVSFPAALLSFFLSLVLINIYKIKLFSDKLKQQSFISWHLSKAFIPVVLVLVIVHGFIHANIIYTSANPAVAAVLLLIVAIVITILIINDLSKSIGNSIELMELEKNKFQKELAHSNERFKLMFYNSAEANGVSKNGLHLFANPAYYKLFGYSEEELKDQPVLDLIVDTEKTRVHHYIKERAKNNTTPGTYETKGKRKDGSEFDFEVSVSLFSDGDEQNMLVTLRNITERKLVEKLLWKNQSDLTSQNEEYLSLFEEYKTLNEEISEKNSELIEANKKISISEDSLRESRKQLLDIIDNTPSLIYACDMEGRYTLANQTLAKLFGTTRENIVGRTRADYIPPEIAEQHRQNELEVMEKKEAICFEENNMQADGNHTYLTVKFPLFNPSNQIYSICGISMDITELKKMEEHRVQLGNILEASLNELYVMDADTYFFKFANKGALLNLGYSWEQMQTMTPFDLISGFNRSSFNLLLEPLRKGDVPKIVFETTHKRTNGTFYPVEVHLQLLNYTGEKIFLAVVQDITDRKIIQNQLIEAKEKAEESDRLKTAFLQNMSHEIRTPMNAIMGFSQLLPDTFSNKAKLELFSDVINQRCLDLLEIINEILDISKIESGQLTVHLGTCNLTKMFSELSDLFIAHRDRIKKQVIHFELSTHCNPEEVIIITDGVKLKQIFINLLNNAFKFTTSGRIEAGCKLDSNNNLLFYVSDTGKGIPPDKQNIIFNRFSQLSENNSVVQGTGLGLAIVKGLVEVLDGQIWVTSEVGKGTVFYFSFPNQVAKPKAAKKIEVKESNPFYFPEKKVLIVEDDFYNAEYIKEIFQNTGFHVIYTEYGIEAVEIAKNQPIDIILMDIRLPDIEGYQASQTIKKFKPDIKIIAQTAYATQIDKQKALDCGCDDYISKPFDRNMLFEKIRKLLENN